jgi:UDP:flavonoid glycosyltransferase YjiC (YdhE family)
MPAFRQQDRQSTAALRAADEKLLAVINQTASVFGHPAFESVGSLFENPTAQITSFPELDPYGPRTDAHYVGPITDGGRHPQVEWSGKRAVRVFAYLQASMVGLEVVLGALRQPDIEVICVVPRAPASIVGRFKSEGFRLTTEPVDLGTLLPTADAVVNYSSAGVVAAALQAGVPLLLFPSHLEQQLTAERAEGLGAAAVYSGALTREKAKSALSNLQKNFRLRRQRAHSRRSIGTTGMARRLQMLRRQFWPVAIKKEPPNDKEKRSILVVGSILAIVFQKIVALAEWAYLVRSQQTRKLSITVC